MRMGWEVPRGHSNENHDPFFWAHRRSSPHSTDVKIFVVVGVVVVLFALK